MPQVRDILSGKGSAVYSVSPTATVLDATRLMNEHKIGGLIVMDGGKVVGMFTERDVLRRVVAEEVSPRSITVGQVMSDRVIVCTPDTDIEDASQIMKETRIRHLPVVDENGKLLGLISIGDLNAFYSSNQEQTITFLQDYIYGRA